MGAVAIFKGKLVKFLAKAGILVPARGDIDRSVTPTAGEMAFNTNANKLEVYNGTSWDQLAAGGGGDPAQNISILTDGSILSDSPVFLNNVTSTGRVLTSAVFENDIYIGGEFRFVTKKSQHVCQNSIIINSTTASVATGFTKSLASGGSSGSLNGVVYASLIDGDSVYLGGVFKSYNDESVNHIVKISLIDGSIDPNFTVEVNSPVYALALGPNNDLYIGGEFSQIAAIPNSPSNRVRIASVNKFTGELNRSFSHQPTDGIVYSIAVDSNNNIYIGGSFTTLSLVRTARGLAKYDANYNLVNSFTTTVGTNLTGDIRAIAVDDTGVYIGGGFTQWNGTSIGYLAKINKNTADIISEFTSPVTGTVLTLALGDNNSVLAGGSFFSTNRNGITKFDRTTGTVDATFIPSGKTDFGDVNSIAVDIANNHVYLGGIFTSASYNRLLKLNLTTGSIITEFDTQVTTLTTGDTSSRVFTLSYSSSGRLYVGGRFINYKNINNLIPRNNLVKYNTQTNTIDMTFDTSIGPNNIVRLISKITSGHSNHIYIAGDFGSYNGISRSILAKINATDATLDQTFAPTGLSTSTIFSILHYPPNNTLIVGGSFTALAFENRNRIGAFNTTDGTLNTSFFVSATGFNNTVRTIVSVGDGLVVGGSFTQYESVTYQGLVKLNYTNATAITAFNTTTGITGGAARVNHIEYDGDNTLYIGGSFTLYKGNSVLNLCSINKTTGAHFIGFGSNTVGPASAGATTVVGIVISPNKKFLYILGDFYGYNSDSFNSSGVLSLAKVNIGRGELDYDLLRTTYNTSSIHNRFSVSFSTTYTTNTSLPSFTTLNLTSNNSLFVGQTSALSGIYRGINTSGGSLFSLDLLSPLGTPAPLTQYTLQNSDINKTIIVASKYNSKIKLTQSLPNGFKCKIINDSEQTAINFDTSDVKAVYLITPTSSSNTEFRGGRSLNTSGAYAEIVKDTTGKFYIEICNRNLGV